MIKAFYTSGTGAKNFQYALDVVANNIANVNSTGYKAQTTQFSDLMYDEENGGTITVGSGSRLTLGRDMSQGILTDAGDGNDYYINGGGYFALDDGDGQIYYMKSGKFTVKNDEGVGYLTDSNGYFVLDAGMNRIASEDGYIASPGIFAVSGDNALASAGGGRYVLVDGAVAATDTSSKIMKSYTELSNVELTNEMTNMITAQRAFQAAAQMIKTADEVEQYANNLTN